MSTPVSDTERAALLLIDPYERLPLRGRQGLEDRMHAAHELNGPTYAHAILTTVELLAAPRTD